MADILDLMMRLKGSDVYINALGGNESEPDEICFHLPKERMSVSGEDSFSLSYLASSIHHFLDPKRILMAWSSKDIFSFLKGSTEVEAEISPFLYDLSLICSYLSIESSAPANFKEAVELLRKVVAHPGWEQFRPLYSSVYIPLVTKVLPDIETLCLVDNSKKSCVYPFYVPEGQANGRLKAIMPTANHYNPHSLGPDKKRNIRPPSWDDTFVYFDYSNMEVNVLQWLSGDPNLGSILESESDPYLSIWSRVSGKRPDEGQRKVCKEVFLPVVFGLGAKSLAAKFGIKEENASKIIDRLVSAFPVAFDWVKSQSADGDNMAVDRFGRRRFFKERELYKIRNFAVQSPASMICLRKLVRIHESLSGLARTCFHVHDGYCVVCDKNEVDMVFKSGIKTLEEEDNMFPGLRLRATCRYGNCLNELTKIERGALT